MPEIAIEQTVRQGQVVGTSFDLLLRFNNTIDQPEIIMDELVKLVLEGLLEHYGQIVVKVNWWSPDLTVIAPNAIPAEGHIQDTPVTPQGGSGSTEESNPTPSRDQQK